MKSISIKKNFFVGAMVLVGLGLGISSCKKVLDKQPETFLTTGQVYRDIFDAGRLAGVRGDDTGRLGRVRR